MAKCLFLTAFETIIALPPLSHAYNPTLLEAGCDEAGRGCLAGPVVAAAVILPANGSFLEGLDDSKQLKQAKRENLAEAIRAESRGWAVWAVSNTEIDQLNILQASVKAMNRAVGELTEQPEHLLIDGHYFHTASGLPFTCVKKGDAIYKAIAAASILAKCHRDGLMAEYDKQYPAYGWARNKGYPTPEHLRALEAHGPTPLHRYSFQRVQPALFSRTSQP